MEKVLQTLKKIARYSFLTLIIVVIIGSVLLFKSKSGKPLILGGSENDYYTASSTVITNEAGKGVVLVNRNPGRGWMVVQNMTATAANLSLYATTSPNTTPILADTKYTIPIAASGSYTFNSYNRYTGIVLATSSAACTFRVTEIY